MKKAELKNLIDTHFGNGDYHLVLTYDVDALRSAAENEKRMQEMLNTLRRLHKAKGKAHEIISLSCYPKSGRGVNHILLSGNTDRKEIMNLWKFGWSECNRIVSGTDKISDYLGTLISDPETHYSVTYVSEKV